MTGQHRRASDQAPEAAARDNDFHYLLAIVDSLRIGQSRERQAAIDELNKYLDKYAVVSQMLAIAKHQ